MKLSLREAFALEPLLKVELGGTAYTVPPLTFGRLDELLKAAAAGQLAQFSTADFVDKFVGGTSDEAVGRALAHFPTEAFAGAAAAVVPGLTAAEWTAHGTPYTVLELIGFFARVHDWAYIGDALYGKRDATDDVSDLDLQTAILLMARELGCRIDEPLGFRAEGFFMAAGAIRSKHQAQMDAAEQAEAKADGWDGARPADQVVPVQTDPAAAANLARLMADADARSAQEGVPNG